MKTLGDILEQALIRDEMTHGRNNKYKEDRQKLINRYKQENPHMSEKAVESALDEFMSMQIPLYSHLLNLFKESGEARGKINMIKYVRAYFNCSLLAAKFYVEYTRF